MSNYNPKNMLILSTTLIFKENPKSTSKIFSIVDSYPCELILSHEVRWRHGKSVLKITNPENGKSYETSDTLAARVLGSLDYEVLSGNKEVI